MSLNLVFHLAVLYPLIDRIQSSNKERPGRGLALASLVLLAVAVGQLMLEMDAWETNYFHVLEVPRSATAADVKRAFRRLSLEAHPDKSPLPKPVAEAKFMLIQKAHETLVNDEQRDAYDRWGETGLKLLERSQSLVQHGLVDTLAVVAMQFFASYVNTALAGRNNARMWVMGGFAFVVAVVFTLRFGAEDPLPTPGDKLTRDEKVRILWSLFPSFITSVVAVQRTAGETVDEQVLSTLQKVVATNQAAIAAAVQAHAAAGRHVDPNLFGRDGAAGGQPGQSPGPGAGAGAAPQQAPPQQAGGGFQVPPWVWFLAASTLLSWITGGGGRK